jgi:hypothetical protein
MGFYCSMTFVLSHRRKTSRFCFPPVNTVDLCSGRRRKVGERSFAKFLRSASSDFPGAEVKNVGGQNTVFLSGIDVRDRKGSQPLSRVLRKV